MQDKNLFKALLFWGGLWGFAEATLGGLLHMGPGVAGSVMFPIGALLMRQAWKETGSAAVVMSMGVIAAALKLSNLLVPVIPVQGTVHAAVSILLESGVVLVLMKQLDKQRPLVLSTVGAVAVWRLAFIGVQHISSAIQGKAGISALTASVLPKLAVGAVLNVVLFCGAVLLLRKLEERGISYRYSRLTAFSVFAIAVAVQAVAVIA